MPFALRSSLCSTLPLRSRAAQEALEVHFHLLSRIFQPVKKVGSQIAHHLAANVSIFGCQLSQGRCSHAIKGALFHTAR
jgi:hypothetical protein